MSDKEENVHKIEEKQENFVTQTKDQKKILETVKNFVEKMNPSTLKAIVETATRKNAKEPADTDHSPSGQNVNLNVELDCSVVNKNLNIQQKPQMLKLDHVEHCSQPGKKCNIVVENGFLPGEKNLV